MFIPRGFFLAVLAFGFSTQAFSQCSGSMAITNPAEHATVNSHFQISAAASSSCSIPHPVYVAREKFSPDMHWLTAEC